jgi:transcriptional regulator with XRE-family HTH domain
LPKATNNRSTTALDKQIGQRIRTRRLELGMAQTSLASEIGVTFQQIQKYERGANRVAAGTLFNVAKCLDLPIATFFPKAGAGDSDALTDSEELLELRIIYSRLTPQTRDLLLVAARAFAGQERIAEARLPPKAKTSKKK